MEEKYLKRFFLLNKNTRQTKNRKPKGIRTAKNDRFLILENSDKIVVLSLISFHYSNRIEACL